MASRLVVTRFAPSPTGFLHLGGARTALYNFLLARQQKGHFLIRIEDTDCSRSDPAHSAQIFEALTWLGLNSDDAPIYQSQRFARYQAVCEALCESGHAYRCYCSSARVAKAKEAMIAIGKPPQYDGHCRNNTSQATENKPFVIRFKMNQKSTHQIEDQVRGSIEMPESMFDDFVIARADGSPTYHLAMVVDDHDSGITHVIRGEDHLANTPKHIALYEALKWEVPHFAHLSMIHGQDGKKLSKRSNAVDVLHYREQGFLPEALCHALLQLGFSMGELDNEIVDFEQMIQAFDLSHVSKSSSTFDAKKLRWLNALYLRAKPDQWLLDWANEGGILTTKSDSARLGLITLYRERAHTLNELADSLTALEVSMPFEKIYEEILALKTKDNLEAIPYLEALLFTLSAANSAYDCDSSDHINDLLNSFIKMHNISFAFLGKSLRLVLTGTAQGPSLHKIIHFMGTALVCKRLQAFISQSK